MKQLHQIVQESVKSAIEKQTKLNEENGYLYGGKASQIHINIVKEVLTSSQISLLEAELERKKGMIKDEFKPDIEGQIPFAKVKRVEGYNQAIQEDISYLQDQITKCKELMK